MQVSKQSRKFCPEVLLFLRTLLNAALDEKQGLPKNHEVCPHGLLVCMVEEFQISFQVYWQIMLTLTILLSNYEVACAVKSSFRNQSSGASTQFKEYCE